MARIFEILITGFLSERESDLERRRVRLRIVDRYFIMHLVRTRARKALDRLHGVAGGSAAAIADDSRPVAQEIRGLDHQRVALPVAARVAHVGTDVGARMRTAVHGDHAGLMYHFLHD